MATLRRQTLAEQTADRLREDITARRWTTLLPGVAALAAELDVSRDTVRAALRLLERDGLLQPRGEGRARAIAKVRRPSRSLRVAILLLEPLEHDNPGFQLQMLGIRQAITALGHVCFFAPHTQMALGHEPGRIAAHVRKTPADAWLVVAGSLELLRWFIAQARPCMALGGRSAGLPIASTGPDSGPPLLEAVHKLIALGHRRMTLIAPQAWRLPQPGRIARIFLDALRAKNIPVGEYNLPDWSGTAEGLQTLLTSLFRLTPPTAIVTTETVHTVALLAFCAHHGIRVPRDLSLVSTSYDSSLSACHPPIAHCASDRSLIIRAVTRWIADVAAGRTHREASMIPSTLVPGGTMTPVPRWAAS